MGVVRDWGRGRGSGYGPGSFGFGRCRHRCLGWCWGGLPVSIPRGKGTTSWVQGLLPLWGISTWTWEYKVCMGSVSECMTFIVVCLYVGCVGASVFMCMHEDGNV
ncbi:hypothetical protein ATANTOWER_026679 [Ataeniobius toweri]|uniref:Transmembrane protein n=1 Tax=Ataeniobius toweri TaxID=208326 RepID=A0ABU7C4G5_9TELE|nr:hypothetical protein [Ataeniobius toweri]